jgi:predicted dehydrogenase
MPATAGRGFAASRRVPGANDAVRVGVAGLRSKGAAHVELFRSIPGVRIAGLCDPDRDILDRELQKCRDAGETVPGFADVRALLDRKDVDAVVVAAPNHWHSLITVWACQAGKDVYVEKPVSHNLWEGRRAADAAVRYGRIVQAGLQGRSDDGLAEAFDVLRKGELGPIRLARGFCYKRRESIGTAGGPRPIPPSVDYDLWTGPAPLGPLMRRELHYDWHWFWDFGNGDLGNQGCHELDMCRWALGQPGLPKSAFSIGGRFGYADDGQTPNTQIVYFDYRPAPILFEVRGLPRKTGDTGMDDCRGVRIGVVIECEHGYFAGGMGGGWTYDNDGGKLRQFAGDGGAGHAAGFIRAVRSRDASALAAPVLEGHVSAGLHHVAEISQRLGTATPFEGIEKAVEAMPAVAGAVAGMKKHLSDNGVDPASVQPGLGPALEIDPGGERFISSAPFDLGSWANGMLTRNYRPPFVVPSDV